MAKRFRFGFKRLDVYQAAVQHFEWTCEVVQRMPKGPFKVVDQAVGASLSVMGIISDDEYNAEEDRLARIAMMLTRLMQKQRRRARELLQLRRRSREAGRASSRK